MIRKSIILLVGLMNAGIALAVFFAYIIPLKYLAKNRLGLPELRVNPDSVKVTGLFMILGALLCLLSYLLARIIRKVRPDLFRRLLIVPVFGLVLMLIRLVYVLIVT